MQEFDVNFGGTIVLVRETYHVEHLRSYYSEIKLVIFPTHEAMIQAAANGEIDAYFTEYMSGYLWTLETLQERYFRALPSLLSTDLHAAVLTGDLELLRSINAAIESVGPNHAGVL